MLSLLAAVVVGEYHYENPGLFDTRDVPYPHRRKAVTLLREATDSIAALSKFEKTVIE